MIADLVESYGAPEPHILEVLSTHKGQPTGGLHNLTTILSEDSRWKGRVQLDTFASRPLLDGRPTDDAALTGVRLWLERVYGVRASADSTQRVLDYVAARNPTHPVRSWLNGLAWDGVERLPSLLPGLFGAADTPLHRAMGVAWLIGAVARVMQPGCKLDTMVVLVGRQGRHKSTGCAALMPDPRWFCDTALDLRSKDALLLLCGVWLFEIAELRGVQHASPELVKAFLSSRIDRYRAPYARQSEEHPRQCVFVGTTNHEAFLEDLTGSRRFWPVRSREVDVPGLIQAREHLWAEALHRYRAQEPWWLSPTHEADLGVASEAHAIGDPWEAPLSAWIALRPEGFTVQEALSALGLPHDRQDRRHASRVGALLARLGCRQGRPSGSGARPRVWLSPDAQEAE